MRRGRDRKAELIKANDSIWGDVVFIDEPELVRAIRARAPEAQIVILPIDNRESIFAPTARIGVSRLETGIGRLTRREHDVLARVATGETNSEIADAMGLARNTVKAYMQSLMRKLGARNRVEALAHARSFGII